ncbi:MAG: restriction endonuclease [Solirubrobacterales bacterium]
MASLRGMTEDSAQIPPYTELLWPTLCAVRELGHSARLEEIDERVIEREGFSEAQQAVLHNDGPRSQLEYRLGWARTYLKGMGALANTARAVWETTPLGRELTEAEIEPLLREFRTARQTKRRDKREAATAAGAELHPDDEDAQTEGWREELLSLMLEMSPAGFEQLAQRLLRGAGFINTTVTGRSGDGGIDGVGVYRLSLVSFPVFFQCKRYRGTVGPEKVRDFRGAMAGRGDKGLLITTGTFTAEAKREATRDGAPPIDMIDGERLCDLLKEHHLGVKTTTRTVEEVEVLPEFFVETG